MKRTTGAKTQDPANRKTPESRLTAALLKLGALILLILLVVGKLNDIAIGLDAFGWSMVLVGFISVTIGAIRLSGVLTRRLGLSGNAAEWLAVILLMAAIAVPLLLVFRYNFS